MPTNLTLNLTLAGEGAITGTVGLSTPRAPLTIGSGSWPAMTLALTYGDAADNKIKQWYSGLRTLAAAGNDDLDFAGSLVNELGESVVLTSIKLLLIAIDAPDGIKKLKVGPQGLTNTFQGPFGGVAATDYKEVFSWEPIINHPFAGYPIVAGTADKIRINNHSAVSVTYRILAAGMTA